MAMVYFGSPTMKVQQLLKNPSLANHTILNEVCAPLKVLGVHFFGYTAIDINNNAYCLGSKPDYAMEYLRRNHARNDVHQHSSAIKKEFHYDFWDYLEMEKHTEELYQMAAAFDQGHTLTITQHEENITHCFHFSGQMIDAEINQRYLDKMDSLHAFISYFKDCLANIPELAAVYDQPINVEDKASPKITLVDSDPRLLDFPTTATQRLRFKKQLDYYLSEKERECLKWLRLGKSAALIAEIKNVSYKTIERYIESAKKKYNCYTLYQLGENIASSGLANFLELSLPKAI